METPDDKPIRQTLKIVEVLECVPGHAKKVDGPPITILTLGHLGEVEQALLLTIPDSQKLVVDLLTSLSHHGDEFAEELLDRHFGDSQIKPWKSKIAVACRVPSKASRAVRTMQKKAAPPAARQPIEPLTPMGLFLTVKFPDGRPEKQLAVLACYACKRGIMFLYRAETSVGNIDAVALVMGQHILLNAHGKDVLPERYWPDLARLAQYSRFKLGSCRGTKEGATRIKMFTKQKYMLMT